MNHCHFNKKHKLVHPMKPTMKKMPPNKQRNERNKRELGVGEKNDFNNL